MQLHLQIADTFDTLASGKILAVGLFADKVVVLQVPADVPDPSAEAPYATELGLLLTLSHAPATPLQGEVRILPPGGGPAISVIAFDGMVIAGGNSANILTKLRPLLVPAAGTFTVEVQVAGETLRASFEIRVLRLPPSQPAAAPADAGAPMAGKRKRARAAKL